MSYNINVDLWCDLNAEAGIGYEHIECGKPGFKALGAITLGLGDANTHPVGCQYCFRYLLFISSFRFLVFDALTA